MKRADLIRRIGRAARRLGTSCIRIRSTGAHEVWEQVLMRSWECGGLRVSIPHHREVNGLTAHAIMRMLEEKLGEDWWR